MAMFTQIRGFCRMGLVSCVRSYLILEKSLAAVNSLCRMAELTTPEVCMPHMLGIFTGCTALRLYSAL